MTKRHLVLPDGRITRSVVFTGPRVFEAFEFPLEIPVTEFRWER